MRTRSPKRFRSALPRGERQQLDRNYGHHHPFRSALPRREQPSRAGSRSGRSGFDPRSREESDSQCARDQIGQRRVSIRAPAKRATAVVSVFVRLAACFDPRSREESDDAAAAERGHLRLFRSALPRRERRSKSRSAVVQPCFDPRSREESDRRHRHRSRPSLCFDPRSREESDRELALAAAIIDRFDPRSREESDNASGLPRATSSSFDPRSREESDADRTRGRTATSCFDPRSREESDNSG